MGDAEVGDKRWPANPAPLEGWGETGEADDPRLSSEGGLLEGLRLRVTPAVLSDLLWPSGWGDNEFLRWLNKLLWYFRRASWALAIEAAAGFGADNPCRKLRSVGEIVSESRRWDCVASLVSKDNAGLRIPGCGCNGGGDPDEELADPAEDALAPTIESIEKPSLLDLWLPAATDVGCRIDMVSAARVIASDM